MTPAHESIRHPKSVLKIYIGGDMFVKKIIAAIQRLLGFVNVTRLSKKEKALFKEAAAALDAGDAKGCASLLYKSMGYEPPSEKPVRLGNGEVTVIKSAMSGPAHDPDYDEQLLYIKETGHYVSLLITHVAVGDWRPDFDTARLADEAGKEIKGKAGKLPPEDRAILERILCKKAPASAPAHKIG
jgi:hypothetical protein